MKTSGSVREVFYLAPAQRRAGTTWIASIRNINPSGSNNAAPQVLC
ncbi:hypothetical protein SAMN05443247_04650 [Bradyrhizobium erythrophlei]|nr:hypothetical protein SAMN05443247_04650 [Bradyrhizobium erythrophlei]